MDLDTILIHFGGKVRVRKSIVVDFGHIEVNMAVNAQKRERFDGNLGIERRIWQSTPKRENKLMKNRAYREKLACTAHENILGGMYHEENSNRRINYNSYVISCRL